MKKTKIFAAYLPQYHIIPENDEFWGEGFTDWVGVKAAKPQFEGHNQPRIPLNGNYYDLSQLKNIEWQVGLANKFGIDGFCIYHYWFENSHKVLEKPVEILRDNKTLQINYFLAWDNNSWVRSWGNIRGNAWAPKYDKNEGKQVLLKYDLGKEIDWENHFDYLMSFFKDERYQKIEGKPVFVLMKEKNDKRLAEMCKYWNKRAIEEGFSGIYFISTVSKLKRNKIIENRYTYEPAYSGWGTRESIEARVEAYFHIKTRSDGAVKYIYDYEKMWKRIIRNAERNANKHIFPCGIVGFDDTPRRGNRARILSGDTPKLFEKYFSQLYGICKESNKELLFLTAWNEWGEGAYLEPDETNGYAYLEALKRAIDACSE